LNPKKISKFDQKPKNYKGLKYTNPKPSTLLKELDESTENSEFAIKEAGLIDLLTKYFSGTLEKEIDFERSLNDMVNFFHDNFLSSKWTWDFTEEEKEDVYETIFLAFWQVLQNQNEFNPNKVIPYLFAIFKTKWASYIRNKVDFIAKLDRCRVEAVSNNPNGKETFDFQDFELLITYFFYEYQKTAWHDVFEFHFWQCKLNPKWDARSTAEALELTFGIVKSRIREGQLKMRLYLAKLGYNDFYQAPVRDQSNLYNPEKHAANAAQINAKRREVYKQKRILRLYQKYVAKSRKRNKHKKIKPNSPK
jgi:DNA-directed RNA polymerase specialized sigma24 family protein